MHFAEQRAAPYSMIDRKHAVYTQTNNVVGTLNLMFAIGEIDRDIHLVKLGTMGEYGTPNIDIEEGWLDVTHKGRTDRMLLPEAARLASTTCPRCTTATTSSSAAASGGCASPTSTRGRLRPGDRRRPRSTRGWRPGWTTTRCSARCSTASRSRPSSALPLTVYGGGSQTRAVLDIRDTVECIRLACENPADAGEFRVFNQATESFSLAEMAKIVVQLLPRAASTWSTWTTRAWRRRTTTTTFTHTALESLGLQPHLLSDTLLTSMFGIIEQHQHRVDRDALRPAVNWRHTSNPAGLRS